MSEINAPVSVMFDLQRNAIEQTNEAVRQSVATQQEFGEMVLDFSPAKQASERSYDAARSLVDSYFEAIDAAMPGQQDMLEDCHERVDDQLNALEATHAEAIETVETNVQDGSELTDELLAEIAESLDEQFELILEANEDVEDQTVEAVQEFEASIEELQADFEAQSEEITGNFETQLEQFQTQLAEVAQDVEAVSDEAAETAASQVEPEAEAAGDELQAIDGLGPTYAERLHGQGIDSFAALAGATAETVADAAEVSETQAQAWIETAQSK